MCVARGAPCHQHAQKISLPDLRASMTIEETMMAAPSTGFEHHPYPMSADRFGQASYDGLLFLSRVLMAFIFVKSGFGKLLDTGGFTASLASKGVPLASVFGVAGPCVEFFGGLAVLLGLQTRYAATLIAVFTLVATAISHRYWEFSGAARKAQEVNFAKNICIVGGFLLLMATGGGRFSLDGLLRRVR
jgi:putative oxidoreductase